MPDERGVTTSAAPADLETRDMLLNIGPAHPAMHGIIRILAKLDGERIDRADVEIGYLHRGFEKMSETVDYNGVIPYTDRLNYVSPLINNMGYCMAVEKLLGVSIPERCHYARVILAESPDRRSPSASARAPWVRRLHRLSLDQSRGISGAVERVTGARMTVTWCCVGRKSDLPAISPSPVEGFARTCSLAESVAHA